MPRPINLAEDEIKTRVRTSIESASTEKNIPLDEAIEETLELINQIGRKPARAQQPKH